MGEPRVLHRPTGIEKLRLFFILKEYYIDTPLVTVVYKIMDGKCYVVEERHHE
jgi:uncharacterized protein YlzI (FlbEa/FlbD family)